ncbi:uncharacterized protein [Periplaneta americana]|uniref:uncharacterized protein n=1 Tax=Periplaneta americana TaxID=6978 RepID=UPI0037E95EF6
MARKWFKMRVLCVCLLAVSLYLVLRTRKQNVVFEATIRNSKPVEVWEFVADFSNMKMLNPTIIDFNILSETGNYDHWSYSAEYTEFLSSLPFIHNFADAHFNVKPMKDGSYVIQSTHSTCFISRLACLSSESEFRFEPVDSNTRCTENVTYECPYVFGPLCHREVMHQRQAIMSNLKKHFSSPVMLSKSM